MRYNRAMPRPRFDKLEPKRRDAILDAAADEFAAAGFEAASFNRIIRAAGVSKGAMYYYFDDKRDLFATCVTAELDGLSRAVGDIDSPASAEAFWDQTQAMALRAFAFLTESPRRERLVRTVLASWAAHAEALAPLLARAEAFTATLVGTGQRLGAVRADLPPSLLTRVLLAFGQAADAWLAEHLDDLPPEEVPPLIAAVQGMMRRAVEPA